MYACACSALYMWWIRLILSLWSSLYMSWYWSWSWSVTVMIMIGHCDEHDCHCHDHDHHCTCHDIYHNQCNLQSLWWSWSLLSQLWSSLSWYWSQLITVMIMIVTVTIMIITIMVLIIVMIIITVKIDHDQSLWWSCIWSSLSQYCSHDDHHCDCHNYDHLWYSFYGGSGPALAKQCWVGTQGVTVGCEHSVRSTLN